MCLHPKSLMSVRQRGCCSPTPHGDHYGLYKKVPDDVLMYIGPMAKELLKVLVTRLAYISVEKGLPVAERMQTYQSGEELGVFQNIQVLPFYVDHSAPDAYMFYIQAAGKKILFCSENHPVIRVLKGSRQWSHLRGLGTSLKKPVLIGPVPGDRLKHDVFMMLARKNANPARKSTFEEIRDEFYPLDGQIIYSMRDGYLKPEHADQARIDFIGDRPYKQLHIGGHACVETIASLIETVNPKVIVPMHTERADEFTAIPEFAPWADRVKVLADGEPLNLDEL